MSINPQEIYTQNEVIDLLKTSLSFLESRRRNNKTPKYIRFGKTRMIRYLGSDLLDFINEQKEMTEVANDE